MKPNVKRELILELQNDFLKEGIEITDEQAAIVIKFAREIHKVNELRCDGITEDDLAVRLKRIKRLHSEIVMMNLPNLSTGGDPRGAPVRFHFDSGKYNTMGGSEHGWAIRYY